MSLRDTPVGGRFFQARRLRRSTPRPRHAARSRLSSGVYRVTLDITHLRPRRHRRRRRARARVSSRPAACPIWGIAVQLYTSALAAQLGHRRLHRSRTDVRDRGRCLGDAPSASIRSTPRIAPIRKPRARTRPPRAAFSTGSRSTSKRLPKPTIPDVQHYFAFDRRRSASRCAPRHFVDYSGVARFKGPALKLCFACFERRASSRGVRGVRRRRRRRPSEHFAVHEALVARYGRSYARIGLSSCRANETGRDRRLRARDRGRSGSPPTCNGAREEQLDTRGRRRPDDGVALYRDLAVGDESDGAEEDGGQRLRTPRPAPARPPIC